MSAPSVAILSLRSLRRMPYYGGIVESEDVLAASLEARVHTVELAHPRLGRGHLASTHLHRLLGATGAAQPYRISPDPRDAPRADVAVVLANDLHDLAMVMGARGWTTLGEEMVIHLQEVGFRDLRFHRDTIRRMQRHVDHFFHGFEAIPAERFRRGRVRTTGFLSGMVDVRRFAACSHVQRPVDVVNYGRRDPDQHRLLARWAEDRGGVYDHDREAVTGVDSVAGHRRAFVARATSARVLVANFARFDQPHLTRGLRTVGLRYWEAMAAGCVVAGDHPVASNLFRSAVEPAGPVRFQIGAGALPDALVAVLEDPGRSGELGRRARRASLLGHDVAHRWRELATMAGLPVAAGIERRIADLAAEAAAQ